MHFNGDNLKCQPWCQMEVEWSIHMGVSSSKKSSDYSGYKSSLRLLSKCDQCEVLYSTVDFNPNLLTLLNHCAEINSYLQVRPRPLHTRDLQPPMSWVRAPSHEEDSGDLVHG